MTFSGNRQILPRKKKNTPPSEAAATAACVWAFHAWFHVELGTETEARSIVMNLDGDDPTSVVEFKNEK